MPFGVESWIWRDISTVRKLCWNGSGVNIASRLESLAPVGGILVSESVYKNVTNKKGIAVTFIGEEQLKGVKEPVRLYQLAVKELQIAYPAIEQTNISKVSV